MVYDANNRIAIKHAAILPNIVRPLGSCARALHKTAKGKYRTAHKKVVSNFSKERMEGICFLESTADVSIAAAPVYALMFLPDYVALLTKSL
jgi:hypothetical protein